MQVDRSLGRSPLFQVMFVLLNHENKRLDLPGVDDAPVNVSTAAAKFDLTMFLSRRDGCPTGQIEYSCDLFDPATIRRLARQFVNLLGSAVAAPDTPIERLELLDPIQQRGLLRALSGRAEPRPAGLTVLDLLESTGAEGPRRMRSALR